MRKRSPVAVLISDVHYNIHMMELADKAMLMAIDKANELRVPLIVAGDLHDTKANLRGECVNAMLETFSLCKQPCFIMRGNHDSINEKSEQSALNFLEYFPYEDDESGSRTIVNEPWFFNRLGSINGKSIHLIPYQHDPDVLRTYLKKVDKGSTVIMHQGIQGSNMGDYVQDKSAITKDDVAGMRVISGHYHTRQTIELPDDGRWDYIGNPYTLGFGEANDPEKGFQVLMSDGSLEFVPSNIRKHVIAKVVVGPVYSAWGSNGKTINPEDLVYAKVYGAREHLVRLTREDIEKLTHIKEFKLDMFPTDTETSKLVKQISNAELMDSLIDSLTNTSDERKANLKKLWRNIGT